MPWVPELFFVECGAVLRRWDLNRILTRAQIDQAIDALMGWPLRVTQVRGLFADAWRLRANVTFADAVYVALAAHLAPTSFLMMADWPTLLACRYGYCTCQVTADPSRANTPHRRSTFSGPLHADVSPCVQPLWRCFRFRDDGRLDKLSKSCLRRREPRLANDDPRRRGAGRRNHHWQMVGSRRSRR